MTGVDPSDLTADELGDLLDEFEERDDEDEKEREPWGSDLLSPPCQKFSTPTEDPPEGESE